MFVNSKLYQQVCCDLHYQNNMISAVFSEESYQLCSTTGVSVQTIPLFGVLIRGEIATMWTSCRAIEVTYNHGVSY